MRASIRRLGMVVMAFVLVGAMSAQLAANANAARPSTWTLEDYDQSACFSPGSSDPYPIRDGFYGVYIDGRWSGPISVGASSLPAGASYDTPYAPLRRGTSDGDHTLAYVHITLPATTPLGTYTASMWATEKRGGTQSVPITLEVTASC